ncbi:CBS domain-containing protein [Methanopyrus sp. KOL6]|uniref:CBS domain-containing protein n=1 Tax=Methanopyrus sp. KOL6 TaxID=1937004 RepID=UPI000B4B14B7|nr:CBS domain-containing protein [Methanopyrus sp. KOL6]
MLTRRSGLPDTSVMRLATTNVVSMPPTATVKSAVDTMIRYGFRRISVTEPGDLELVGILTGKDVLDYLVGERRKIIERRYEGTLLPALHEPVRSLMRTEVYVITPYDTVRKAVRTMFEFEVGALPVVKDKKLVGIITERDVMADLYDVLEDTKVEEIMTEDPETVPSDITILEAAEIMVDREFRRLPVVENGRLCGLVTATDVLHHVSSIATETSPDASVEEVMDVPVEEIMTEDVITIEPDVNIEEAALTMKGANVGSLVVTDGDDVIGVITERDITYAIAERM